MKYGRERIETRRDKKETGYVTPVSLGSYHNFASTTTTKKQLHQNMKKKKKKKAQAQRNKRQQRQILKKNHKKTLNRALLKSV